MFSIGIKVDETVYMYFKVSVSNNFVPVASP